uniref:Small ribosomal subunit protein mS29 n=1 Tax=Chenopodium quinoa TaxID=63459 RepID=A0A803LCX5_CHEQI
MWRRFLTTAVTSTRHRNSSTLTPITAALSTNTTDFSRHFSAKPSKSTLAKAKKKFKGDGKSDDVGGGSSAELDADVEGEQLRLRSLAEDDKDRSLDGLPSGMLKEFEDTKRCALLVRQSFLDLRDNFRRIVDPPTWSSSAKAPKPRKQIVLDGPRSCGKSIALAMLAHWARDEGWLDFLKFNETCLRQLPCHISEPIPLGEGAGVGFMKGADSMAMPDGSTLYDLIQTGVTHTHAAVGVLVRLRKELSLVKDVPVLLAIDQYNNWFTFSEFEEVVTPRSSRPIHAKELATVNAFRPMTHDDMMVGAFSHSTAVGKLRKDLPGVPDNARIDFPRYTLDEAAAVCHYYVRQRLIRREVFTEEKWKKMYYLANGNGSEMRWLSPLMW